MTFTPPVYIIHIFSNTQVVGTSRPAAPPTAPHPHRAVARADPLAPSVPHTPPPTHPLTPPPHLLRGVTEAAGRRAQSGCIAGCPPSTPPTPPPTPLHTRCTGSRPVRGRGEAVEVWEELFTPRHDRLPASGAVSGSRTSREGRGGPAGKSRSFHTCSYLGVRVYVWGCGEAQTYETTE